MSSTQNENLWRTYVLEARSCLDKNDLDGFMRKIVLLGQWTQQECKIHRYKDHQDQLKSALAKFITFRSYDLNFNQKVAFNAFQNAWQDESLPRLKTLFFSRDQEAPVRPNSCLWVKTKEKPGWTVIPVDAEGKKQAAIDFSKLDDVAVLADKLPESLLDKNPAQYSSEEKMLVARLKRSLKRANLSTLDQTSLAAKSVLSKEIRHQTKLGLETFALFCQERIIVPLSKEEGISLEILPKEPTIQERRQFKSNTYVVVPATKDKQSRVLFYESPDAKAQTIKDAALHKWFQDHENFEKCSQEDLQEKIRSLILVYHCRLLDEKSRAAIRHYQTRYQKITRFIGNVLAAVTAFTYGGVELVATMLGFFVAACIVWSNPLMAIGGLLLLAGAILLPFPSTWANWKVFSTYVPEFFNKIRSEYNEIGSPKKKAFFWGLTIFALATGIAAGGLAYTATIALPAMLGLTAISAAFPPLGVFFAIAIAITQTCMLIRNFATILRKEDSWKAFKAPFLKVNKILNDSNAGWGRRIFTWFMVGALAILAALGLCMSCFTSTRSVGKMFIDQFKTAPEKALAWGIAIGSVGSFLSRIYFTLDSAISSALIICKRLLRGDPAKFFINDPKQYSIYLIPEDVEPKKIAEKIKLLTFDKKDNIIILTGAGDSSKIAYFIKQNKLVNSEKEILNVHIELTDLQEKNLQGWRSGFVTKTAENQARVEQVIQKTVTQATAKLIAQQTKLPPLPPKKLGAIAVDSVLAGGFYAQNMLSLSQESPQDLQQDINLGVAGMAPGPLALLATGAFLTSGARYVVIDLKHADDPEDPYADARQAAAIRRNERNVNYYLKENPNCIFVPRKGTKQNTSTQNSSVPAIGLTY